MNDQSQLLDLARSPIAADNFRDLCGRLHIKERTNWADNFGMALRAANRNYTGSNPRTLSLFSGVGGLDIAFHDVGFGIVEMVEIDSRFSATLSHNIGADQYFKSGHVATADVRDLLRSRPLAFDGKIDLIIGGPPCQTFSAAGRRAAGVRGTGEARGTLFSEYVRLLRELQPEAFVFENVYGITGAQGGEAWAAIREAFSLAGYTLYHRVLDAADYGVPQHRERMFLVGTRGRPFLFPRPTHGPDSVDQHPFYTPEEALFDIAPSPEDLALEVRGRYGDLLPQIPPGLNFSFFTERMGHPRPLFAWRSKFSDFLYKAAPDRPIRTLKAFCGQFSGPFHWNDRRFSTTELKRLQTIPDRYEIIGSRRSVSAQIGNSVPPQMGRILALAVATQLYGRHHLPVIPLMDENEPLGFRQRKRLLTAEYKKTAARAIKKLDITRPQSSLSPCKWEVSLTDRFDLRIESSGSHAVSMTESANVARFLCTADRRRARPAFRIILESAEGLQWDLSVPRISLEATDFQQSTFLILWKCFEYWIRDAGIRDDLVQLFGYYAYPPSVTCRLEAIKELPQNWARLSRMLAGLGTREIHTKAELEDIHRVPSDEFREWLQFLRYHGYEIRSARSNPQIPEGRYLIPYAFPTLTARSILGTKSLF